MFSLFLRPISPRDVQLYALRDEIEHSKRFYLSLTCRVGIKTQTEYSKRFYLPACGIPKSTRQKSSNVLEIGLKLGG